jgi:MarR family transcriptional regulator, 2-MHQ and catechol-resistance regulon repressor
MTASLQREIKKKRPFEMPEQEAVLNLLRTADQLQIRFARLFRQYGLTPQQYNILRILRGEGRPLPILEIASRMITVVPGITGLIDRLESASLVERKRCEQDRRVTYVAIAPQAAEILRQIDGPLNELHRQVLGHMSADELAALNRLLEKARQPAVDGAADD